MVSPPSVFCYSALRRNFRSGVRTMICSHCQREIAAYSSYCSFCGAPQRSTASCRRLVLSSTNSKIGGVCGGLGEYWNVDPTMVRLIWVALSVIPGAFIGGVLAYVLAWLIIPKAQLPAAKSAEAPFEHAAKST